MVKSCINFIWYFFIIFSDIRLFNKENTSHCFIDFSSPETAKAALSSDGTSVDGNIINVSNDTKKDVDKNSIYISRLNKITTKEKLRSVFQICGAILEINLKNGPINNYAFIEFESKDSLDKALNLNGLFIDGISVKTSLPSSLDADTCVILINLLPSITKENIIESFKSCGKILYIFYFLYYFY